MQIFLIIIAVLLALLLQYLLSRNAAQGITAQIEPDTDAAEPDERFRLILRVRNNSRLIRPFVRYKIMLPEEMHIHSGQKAVRIPPHLVQVSGTMFLWPKKGCEQIIEVSVSVRGAYRFGNIRIETGDFLGLKEEGREIPGFRSVAIYPKQADSPGIEHTIGSIMGDYSVRRYIFEDPVITAGFREYTGREPFRDISWTHSAHAGKLMVRNYDHTSQLSATVVLDSEGAQGRVLEMCLSLVRAVCSHLESCGIEYDLFLNSEIGGAGTRTHHLIRGLGARHFYGILFQLANVLDSVSFSAETLAENVMEHTGMVTGIILITPSRLKGSEDIYKSDPQITLDVIYADEYLPEEEAEE